MHKLIAILATLLATFALGGCGGGEPETVTKDALVASLTQGDFIEITQNYDAKGDKAVKLRQVGTVQTDGLDEATIESIRAAGEETRTKIAEIEGASYDMQEADGALNETITLSLEDPEIVQEIIDSGLLPATGQDFTDTEDIAYISIQATKESLETQGFTIEKAPEESDKE